MSGNDDAHDLLVRGVAAAKANERKEARFFLEWALRMDPPLDQRMEAWFWLSEVSDDPKEVRDLIEEILAHNPGDGRARRKLAVITGRLKPEEIVDPDRLAAPAAGPQAADASRFTCPKCGGRMTFTPDGQSLTCEYCERREQVQQARAGQESEQDFVVAMAKAEGHLKPVDQLTFDCQGCGASFVLPAGQMTLTCPYCESTYVVKNSQTRELIAPTGVIPFQIDENEARQVLRRWLAGLNGTKKPRVTRGVALYLPLWTFDVGGQVSWTCEVQKQRDWARRSDWLQRGEWEILRGERVILHDDILVPASTHLNPACREALNGFDLRLATRYDPRLLAAWPAETYQVAMGDAALEARQVALSREREAVARDILQPYRDLKVSSAQMIVESFKLLLAPIWLVHYQQDDRRFQLVINGQTGQITGEAPRR